MGLSEPKRRVKYSIDPNALRWANDETKFGRRLMEKMGWQQGEGLGAKSNGMTEHIKVKFKSDTKGVGFNNNEYDNVWLDHQDGFESVLASLNKGANSNDETIPSKPVNSLVEKSKERRGLHYSKFKKSKDLSRATENDLACILGTEKRIKLKQEEEEKQEKTAINKSNESKSDLCFANNHWFEPITKPKVNKEETTTEVNSESQLLFKTNTLSISDYFAQKMKSKLKKSDENSNDSLSSSNELVQPIEQEVEQKKKKKKSKHYTEEEKTEINQEPTLELEKSEEVESEKKKKKKKSKRSHDDDLVEQVVVEQIVEEEQTIKKKKKKSKNKEEEEETTETITSTTEVKIETKLREDSFADAIISDKSKKADKKRQLVGKNLEKDPKFYEMLKKPSSAY